MRLIVAVVGKPRNAALAAAITEYETRAAHYWPLDVHEVREERAPAAPAEAIRRKEGERLRQRAGTARIVACHEKGRTFTSKEFSQWLSGERDGNRDTAFVVGGALGLSEDLLDQASMKLSLAPWTLPHELARLVLAEQLYRAGSIARGEPYHK